MSQGTVLQTNAGAALALSASLPATYDAAGYGATGMVYTEIGQIEDFGEHGMNANVSTFTAVKDAAVQKFKGSKNYGTKNLMLGNLPSDTGQALAITASESTNRYSAKITYPLRAGEATAEIQYLDVLVTRAVYQDGNVDNVRKLAVTLELCRKQVVVAAT